MCLPASFFNTHCAKSLGSTDEKMVFTRILGCLLIIGVSLVVRVTGQRRTLNDQFPSQGYLYHTNSDAITPYDMYNPICGVTIINLEWVITSASCLYDNHELRPVTTLFVIVGLDEQEYDPYDVNFFVHHPDYDNNDPLKNNIAMLKMWRLFAFNHWANWVRVVPIIPNPPANHEIGIGEWTADPAEGMGHSYSLTLLSNVQTADNITCQKNSETSLGVDEYCMKIKVDDTQYTLGNGSGLIYNDTVIGILSWYKVENGRLIYTAVYKYVDWIARTLFPPRK